MARPWPPVLVLGLTLCLAPPRRGGGGGSGCSGGGGVLGAALAAASVAAEVAATPAYPFGGWGGNATARRLSCIAKAEAEIARAPDKDETFVTTTPVFKRDVARFFCTLSSGDLTVLELGVYKGHSTAVLAAVFGQVIAVDVEPQYLKASAAHNAGRRNIVFMAMDTYSADWGILATNRVDAAVIDADHKYEKVRADAMNVLDHFPFVLYLVFDDYGVEADVRRVVTELLEVHALRNCRPIGQGKDGRGWLIKSYGWINHTEGMLCARGPGSPNDAKAPFLDVTYLIYAVPAESLVRAEGVMSFRPDGRVWSSHWGGGAWEVGDEGRDVLNMMIPLLPPWNDGVWEVLFNRGRSAFVLTPEGTVRTSWFGIRADKVNQIFRMATELFD